MLCGNGVPAEFATTSVVFKLKLNTPQNTKCYNTTASSKKATKKATVLSAAKPKTLQDPTINRAGGCGEQWVSELVYGSEILEVISKKLKQKQKKIALHLQVETNENVFGYELN